MTLNEKMERDWDETILENDYPVFPSYWYVVDGTPRRSPVEGTVRDLKRVYRAAEVRRCDAVARQLPLYGWDG